MRGGTVGSVRQVPADLTTTTRARRLRRVEEERRRILQTYVICVRIMACASCLTDPAVLNRRTGPDLSSQPQELLQQ